MQMSLVVRAVNFLSDAAATLDHILDTAQLARNLIVIDLHEFLVFLEFPKVTNSFPS